MDGGYKMMRTITAPPRAELLQLRRHYTYEEIGSQYGVDRDLVAAWFVELRAAGAAKIACPACGCRMRTGAHYDEHVRTCPGRPPEGELMALVRSGAECGRIAARYGIAVADARRWLADLGRVFEVAPFYGRFGGCTGCPGVQLCSRMVRMGLWCLCEAPRIDQVAQAFLAGKFKLPADYRPAWLPVLGEPQ